MLNILFEGYGYYINSIFFIIMEIQIIIKFKDLCNKCSIFNDMINFLI